LIASKQEIKIKEVDEKIRILKENQSEKLQRPVAAFITFEVQEGYERACNLKGTRNWKEELVQAKHKFMDEFIAFQEAPEPTNIIWENRDTTFN
jgi:hypothetical protein